MAGINLKLQGQFKFDLYTPQGDLIKTSEFIDNFITNSGVSYPYHFAFADCFRFLSVGSGSLSNSVTTLSLPYSTTGLQSGIPAYSYIGSRTAWDGDKSTSNYATPGNFGAGCGYTNNSNGVSLIRQWNLPDNTGGVFPSSGTFSEFMVSPGRPYIKGTTGKYCGCNDIGEGLTGMDCSSISEYYEWLSRKYLTINSQKRLKSCDATAAFARVVSPFDYSENSILTITYKLNLIFDTGINYTSLTHHRGDASPNWNHLLNSYSSITQPGVKLINDGTIYAAKAPAADRLQHFTYDTSINRQYSFENEYGESFVPPLGAPLEPSNFFLLNDVANQNVVAYLSNENTQFLVNKNGGSFKDTGHYAPWNIVDSGDIVNTHSFGDVISSGGNSYRYINVNPSTGHYLDDSSYWINDGNWNTVYPFSSGVMPFRNENAESITSGSSYWSARPNSFNTRRNSGTFPSPDDITQNVTELGKTFTSVKVSSPDFIFSLPPSGTRGAKVIYAYSFENYSFTSGLPIKSFVLGYKDLAFGTAFGKGDVKNIVPFFDAVFSGISGNSNDIFIPNTFSGDSLPSIGTGVFISGANDVEYNTLEGLSNSVYPIINTYLSWSVPCPNGVNGCP